MISCGAERDGWRLPMWQTDARPLLGFSLLVLSRIVAVNGSRRVAEAVLERERHPASRMVLELRHADENVGVFERMVQVERGIDIRRDGNLEPRIALALAEVIGVFKLHVGRGTGQRAHVPTRIEHVLFERPAQRPTALDEPDARGAGASHQVSRCAHQLGMRVMRDPQRPSLEAISRAAGEVQFDRDGLALDDALEPADLIEHRGQSCGNVGIVG